MDTLKIEAILNGITAQKESKNIVYYLQKNTKENGRINTLMDKVEFNKNTVNLVIGRTNKINKNTLDTPNSITRNELAKSLVYLYFTYGKFNIERITLYFSDGTAQDYEHNKILTSFSLDLDDEYAIKPFYLFSDSLKKSNDEFECLSLILLANQNINSSYDYIFKCFNVLFKNISSDKHKHDFQQIDNLINLVKNNNNLFTKTINYVDKIDREYLSNLFICKKFRNDKKHTVKNDKTNGVSKSKKKMENITDFRLVKIIYDYILNTEEKTYILFDNEKTYLTPIFESRIKDNHKSNNDMAEFLIEYSYYLRCAYFHGERLPIGILFETAENIEVSQIKSFVLALCKDILENYDYFLARRNNN